MTEEEARLKWCPFARVTDAGCATNCIASECMAWRWIRQPTETAVAAIKRYREEHPVSLLDAKNYVEAHPEYIKQGAVNHGFCGLAGRE